MSSYFDLCSFGKSDSLNGSKTQSTATTESNTPDNTLRVEGLGQRAHHNFRIENNEVVLDSEFVFRKN